MSKSLRKLPPYDEVLTWPYYSDICDFSYDADNNIERIRKTKFLSRTPQKIFMRWSSAMLGLPRRGLQLLNFILELPPDFVVTTSSINAALLESGVTDSSLAKVRLALKDLVKHRIALRVPLTVDTVKRGHLYLIYADTKDPWMTDPQP